ncbi:hypothetical protein [Nostoc sp.]|uniref:hypothetical protein n=1 Tax=Nostoc sp. TaxID=1180 RepID=UPI002FF6E84E
MRSPFILYNLWGSAIAFSRYFTIAGILILFTAAFLCKAFNKQSVEALYRLRCA